MRGEPILALARGALRFRALGSASPVPPSDGRVTLPEGPRARSNVIERGFEFGLRPNLTGGPPAFVRVRPLEGSVPLPWQPARTDERRRMR